MLQVTDWLAQAAQPAQWPGWAAFAFGVACFAQTDDRRFRWLMAAECLSYAIHFAWLGQPAAAASTGVSLARALVSLRWRSGHLAWAFIAVNAGFAAWFYQGPLSLMPLAASICGTWALFRLQGLAMRALMLGGTLIWVLHNAIAGSVGGTLLELVVAAVNAHTMWQLWRARPPHGPATAD
ncbi:YgjV family protein [Aquabacterium sp. OR-4]|uniref:YgjV family protein n=1 Tax=Aquabacterium sp. OR-4 TaxID=2978127 RepID=UPI0021B41444|nr:YgjV family protein [Aquabacterium sp. OR-4]MDT7837083.1 YgjV family protein [Aquabacterium sp. OR-4]